MDTFGEGEADQLLSALCQRPPLTLRTNTLRTDRDSLLSTLCAAGWQATPGLYAPEALRVKEGAVTDLPAFAAGDFFVQDEASQLCVQALDARPGMTVVDTCACPGSKSFGVALSMGNSGAVYAFDLHESKLSLIRSGAARLGLTVITAAQRDARCPDPALYGRADRVLCDVPCSGLGVLAKKPEIRHKDLSSLCRLPAIQREILDRSAAYVKPGGLLVYSTCTFLPAENQQVVGAFLDAHPDFVPEDFCFSPLPDGGAGVSPVTSQGGMVTLTPHRNGTDGFFIARMRRVARTDRAGKEGEAHD
jgi:16S rRNA (cytosine967-C5)-methyltransferase